MRYLMVSPFPPLRDGVGKYARNEVLALRADGHEVEVLSPVPCAAHYVEELKGGLRFLTVRRYADRYDGTIVQYQPSYFHNAQYGRSRVISNLAMLLTFATAKDLSVVAHEIDYQTRPPTWRPERLLERLAWQRARRVIFHTEREVRAMQQTLGVLPRGYAVRRHDLYFRPAVSETKLDARRRLGRNANEYLFLCIGFIQPHKGFDRAIRSFRRLARADARLAIVGSLRVESPELSTYLEELRAMAAGDRRIELHEVVLSDEEFDRWIVAADVVVLPYREIWSSGVIERAKVLGRVAIVTNVGGLAEQIAAGHVIVDDDEGLTRAMAQTAASELISAPRLNVQGAQRFVEEEASRRRGPGSTPAAPRDALRRLGQARAVRRGFVRSGRRVVGRAVNVAKSLSQRVVDWHLLPVVEQLNVFHARTVEAIEELSSEIEALKAVRGEVQAARDEAAASARQLGEKLLQLERRTRALLETAHERTAASASTESSADAALAAEDYTAFDYCGFEHRHRGDTDALKERQRAFYLDALRDHAPVLDVGCGRGELLEVLREAGIESRGVDTSLDMVAECRAKGLEVEQIDGITYLESRPEASLGAVFSAQFVEHLAPRDIVRFVAAARRAIRPGGVLVNETINPACLFALANYYFMDLTHRQPVHPETLRFIYEQEGFTDIEVRYLMPKQEPRPPLQTDGRGPKWAEQIAVLDAEVRQLNDIVLGAQDYAAIGRVPTT